MDCIEENNIVISFEKSKFLKNEVTYLGHIISAKGIQPDATKAEDLKKRIKVKNKKQLMKVLGAINWFREFIPQLSIICEPLTGKLRKVTKFIWSDEDEEIIRKFFKVIKRQITLAYPDYYKPFILGVYAADKGIGAVLYQENSVLGIYSAKINRAEVNNTISEKEFLAILKGLEHFRNIVFGAKITIFIDHINLLYNKGNIVIGYRGGKY